MARYAYDNDLVVVSVDYRLAPESPAPKGANDCYSGLKYVISNAFSLGIDKERICIGGESGGGNLVINVGRILVKNNEEKLVKLIMGSSTMSSNMWHDENNCKNTIEKVNQEEILLMHK